VFGPAISGGDSGIDAVVQQREHGDRAGLVGVALGRREGTGFAIGGEGVVEAGEGQVGVRLQPGFSMRVEFLGDGGNFRAERGRRVYAEEVLRSNNPGEEA
jgi:hypothetical protein